MTKEQFIGHPFAKGEPVLYKGGPARVVSVHRRSGSWMHLVVSFGKSGRSGNFAAAGYEDIDLPEPPAHSNQ